MSKFLSLCNELISVPNTCGEPLPSGGERTEKFMKASGLLHKAKLTHDEMLYGMAVVGNGFDFEARLQQRARMILALSMTLSDDKLALRSAGLAKLVICYIRGEIIRMQSKEMAIICGCKERQWRDAYRAVYLELCSWCNDLETSANIKVWKVLESEKESA